jgi:uncharacterized protein YdiU (UPF0061 family)
MSSADASVVALSSAPVSDPLSPRFNFDNTYARLPDRFYSRVKPTAVSAPSLIKVNVDLAEFLGLDADALSSREGVDILSGNRVAEGSEPLALAYAGHQFGHFVPQLGDGRANLLGEVMGRDGVRYDVQLKGSGPTPFSRRGDGRAAIGPVLREYLVSEAMAALGVPTTRALAAVTTGDRVFRETVLPGAVLTRVAASHLRVGTFQYFAAQGDTDGLRTLANYAISRHYPEVVRTKTPYQTFLDQVITRHARLVAQWMLLGFIHGVMNTDNTSISGETIDYGPCAFMEAFDPAMVFSSIDHQGRYAYDNQPRAALWNLTRLAETLLPLLEEEMGSSDVALDSAKRSLAAFMPQFEAARAAGLCRKIGLHTEDEKNLALAEDLLQRMTANRADFTLTFRLLCDASKSSEGDAAVRALFDEPGAFDDWAAAWRGRLRDENLSEDMRTAAMRRTNPAFIPRNHMVEEAILAAAEHQDYKPFEDLLKVVSHPFEDRADLARYAQPARPEECVQQTFCGT